MRYWVIGLLIFLAWLPQSFAAPLPAPALTAAEQQLAIERENNQVAAARLAEMQKAYQLRIQQLKDTPITQAMLQHASLNLEMAQIDANSINLSLADTQQTITRLQSYVRDLEEQLQELNFSSATNIRSSYDEDVERLNTQIEYQQQLLKLAKMRLKELQQAYHMASQRLQLEREWYAQLQIAYEAYHKTQQQQTLTHLESNLQHQQQQWLERLAELNQQASSLLANNQTANPAYAKLSAQIVEAEEMSNLSYLELNLAKLRMQVEDLSMLERYARSINSLNAASQQMSVVLEQLQKLAQLVDGKVNLFNQRIELEPQLLSDDDSQSIKAYIFTNLARDYKKQLTIIENLQKQAQATQTSILKELRAALAKRQTLPGFNTSEWLALAVAVLNLGSVILQVAKSLLHDIKASLVGFSIWEWLQLLLFEVAWLALWRLTHYVIQTKLAPLLINSSQIVLKLFSLLISVIKQNSIAILIFGAAIIGLYYCSDNIKVNNLIASLIFVSFAYHFALDFAKLLLVPNHQASLSGYDVKLYQRLRWALLVGAGVTLLTVSAHALPVQYEAQDFFNRLFMLFLLGVAVVLLRTWKILPDMLPKSIQESRPYLARTLRLLCILIPALLLSNALLGLIGYVELAWTISRYQVIFLCVLSCFLIIRGLLKDAMESFAGYMVRHLRNGWLWTEALLKPFDRLLGLILVFYASVSLFHWYGWDNDPFIVNQLQLLLHHPIAHLGKGAITSITLLQLSIGILALIWATRWAREFAYRWLFAKVHDLGLRNSLAIFSQYLTVIIGFFIELKILGIDFTGLAFVATGLSVGIGFGLRDLANNFVCGILLLIERPVRKGDLVTMGDYEGEVTHIGMRAMTIYTSDHTEVLVPNSEAFAKSFTNWTHQDSIVRGVVIFKTTSIDDPHLIRSTALEVLRQTPGIVSNPESDVYLDNIVDGILAFKVHYFINLQLTPCRSEMRSKVLFAIWERFHSLGIELSCPQYEIHVKSFPLNVTR